MRPFITIVGFCLTISAQAGMTVYDLNDVVKLRLQDISLFTMLLLGCGFGIQFLWNTLAKDIPRIPQLSYKKALCLTGLLSILMLLILTMISGARELLTPGAWRRQGSEYRLNDPASEPTRRTSMESLRTALNDFAKTHENRFPAHDYVPEIPEKLWQAPDVSGTRYMYVGGLERTGRDRMLACEPMSFGDERFVLFTGGEIKKLATVEIRKLIGIHMTK